MAAQKFKVGQIVRLRSGGPDMTVSDEEVNYPEGHVQCQWFGGRKLEKGTFPPESLIFPAEDGKTDKNK